MSKDNLIAQIQAILPNVTAGEWDYGCDSEGDCYITRNNKVVVQGISDIYDAELFRLAPTMARYILEQDKPAEVEELQETENFIQTKFGYCFYCLEPNPLIYNLYVHPKFRRCGHSKILLRWIINEIRKTGYAGEISIQAKPSESSMDLSELIKYYKSMGLKIMQSESLPTLAEMEVQK